LSNINAQPQIQEWSRRLGRPISNEEFTEICTNLNGFFTTLKTWSDDEERMKLENERIDAEGNFYNANKK